VISLLESGKMAKNKAKVSTPLPTVTCTKATGSVVSATAKVSIAGHMVRAIMENGATTKCTKKEKI
jgi:hypothetical protein